jgi:uncharacterized protein (TIGR04222 family)
MDHPWGISGPAFVAYYGVALLVALGTAVYLRRRARHPRLAEPLPVGDWNVVAYLVGGPRRVVETALARLVEQDAVRVTRKGMVTRTTKTVPDPLDQEVLDQLGGLTRRVYDVIERAAGLRAITALDRSCAAQRLTYDEGLARRSGLTALYLLLAIGGVRLVNGMAGGYPVGYLVLELLVTGSSIVWVHTWGRRVNKRHTAHGQRVVYVAAESGETAARVALGGVGAYPDQVIGSAMKSTMYAPYVPSAAKKRVHAATAGAAGATCGGGGSSGSSSCGGGGGGGGGGS